AGDESVGDEAQLVAGAAQAGEGGVEVVLAAGVLDKGGVPEPGQLQERRVVQLDAHVGAEAAQEDQAVKLASAELGPEVGPANGAELAAAISFEVGQDVAALTEKVVGAGGGGAEYRAGVHRLEVDKC